MGGWGNGQRDHKPGTSKVMRLDIRYFRKHNLLQPGTSREWIQRGSIGCAVSEDGSAINLAYSSQRRGDPEPRSMHYPVPLESIPCRYGGKRLYFRCPSSNCHRRCELLYSCGAYFICRKCCGYVYPSQKGEKLGKLLQARGKLVARIFAAY